MVLCKFFQQGSCRFGSKCVNEHFDVRQVIKTDVEAAINGKQWPLSTYGPFKDKPSIPNFIEDQSFEEVRMLCYEAKQKNFFDQFHQQFNKEALEASNKMKALLQMTRDIVDVVISVYDTPSDTTSGGVTLSKANSNNPFGMGNAPAANVAPIFAKSNTNGSNIFGNNNAFGTSAQGSTSIFGNSTAFGAQQQQQTSIFGQSSKPANSMFGDANNINTQQTTSVFGQQQVPLSVLSSSGQQQTGIFGQQQNSNIFKQASQTTQHPQGLFSQAAQQAASGQGLFAQAAQQTQNLFGQGTQQHANPNIFQQNPTRSTMQPHNINADIIQQNQQQQVQNQQSQNSLLQQAALQAHSSAGQMNQLSNNVHSTVYSRLEDLTTDEIEAFKADYFQLGKIPFNPPPRELIN